MQAFVTGGAGFSGPHLVDRLVARGDDVRILDHLTTGRIDNIRRDLGHSRERFVHDGVHNAPVSIGWRRTAIRSSIAPLPGVRHIGDDPLGGVSANVEGTREHPAGGLPILAERHRRVAQ